MSPIKVFVSYSHNDHLWLEEDSDKCLIPFFQRFFGNEVEFWYDLALSTRHPGEKYKQIIEKEINESAYALLLINNNFVSSSFIKEVEIVQIKKLFDEKKIKIIPILIGAVELNNHNKFSWLLDLQILPSINNPLIKYTATAIAWDDIKNKLVLSLRNTFTELPPRRSHSPIIPCDSISSKSRKNNSKIILFGIAVLIVICSAGYYLLYWDNHPNKEITKDALTISHIPIFDSLGGDEKMDFISGSVKQGFLQDNCIAVYAYTNMWYIQPIDTSPLTPINNDGTWKIQTHLGSKYCIMLVKKTYAPPKLLTNLPLTNSEIINMQIIPKTE